MSKGRSHKPTVTDTDSKCIDKHMEKGKESESNTAGKTKETDTISEEHATDREHN